MPDEVSQVPQVSLPRKIARWVVTAIFLTGFVLGLRWLKYSGLFEMVLKWVAGLGVWAPVMFILIYFIAATAWIPASLLTIGAGILFGLFRGTAFVFVGAMLAAMASFLIARRVARAWVARKMEHHPRFKALDRAAAREGWKLVALVRLGPFPFAPMNYGFGITRMSFSQFTLGSMAMVPGTMLYVYIGTLIGDLASIDERSAAPWWVKWAIAGIFLFVSGYLARFAKRALHDERT